MTLQVALVGCGGMGLRHALGYIEYRRVLGQRSGGLRLAAVCGRQVNAANYVADRVGRETGDRPAVYGDFEAMLAGERSLEAVDIVTSTPAHHVLALRAMEAGLHVMTEKPMGLTLKACRLMRDRATREGKILAVAENFRRDPMNRLTRALIATGAIGRPYFALDLQVRSAHRSVMHGTVWRAKRDHAGGMVLEVGVHNADMLLYLLGAVTRVSAETSTYERFRPLTDIQTQSPTLAPFYAPRRPPQEGRSLNTMPLTPLSP
jgi:predicted dehydrogenase